MLYELFYPNNHVKGNTYYNIYYFQLFVGKFNRYSPSTGIARGLGEQPTRVTEPFVHVGSIDWCVP